MSPFTVSAVRSPETSVARISSFTLLKSIRPRAFSSVTAPITDLSDTLPAPPRTVISPCTVSAVISFWAPSTLMSVDPGQVQGHPGRYGDGVVDLRRPAPSRLGLHADDLIGRVDPDPVPARVLGHDAHRVAAPRLDGDLPPEVVDLEAGARPHRDGRIGLLHECERRERRQGRQHAGLSSS